MVLTTDVPTREQILARVQDTLPTLRKNADWNEENRRVHEESIEALADAGVFKLRTPVRYGGYESDTRTLVDVASAIGTADGSTSWVASVYWIPTWMACLFPDHVQDEVFSTPDVRICGTLSPTAMAVPVDGGIVVNGKWGFISGAHHSHWQVIVTVLVAPEGEPQPMMALVPMSDLQVIDDWNTSGLKATGSVSTAAQDLFIPADRVLHIGQVLTGLGVSAANATSAIYNAPLLPVASASSVGALLGMARGARAAFFERLPERKITYTGYTSQAEAPLTHLQVADAEMKIDEAEFHAHRLASLVDAKAAEAAQWTMEQRVKARADMGSVVRLAKEAVEIYASASGGSSIYSHQPIQRFARDVQAVNLHALMHPNTNAELYGRLLCGLQPNTLYV
ncbi:acyl-CoA dehydrogenase [Sphaerisporangium siamense]|uniref:Alkylation response protein AidB-like acyl-CoA dehydrogenase n=1 Tax=Sphaerisporangium siamense TaxID=795645 RepID=A0A7W7DAM7_9ACTN|nr:acyl-CoA dehydrogenase family protein [Sphaerisporangium siamense]MBB4702470.1 alkylation response protein AidB-like acyl-CoA dehydrogenase [Sphaerisporangium siamense]GII88167.1 acyl-CoA dehydrogenase [Sphaerisporangium siamense]